MKIILGKAYAIAMKKLRQAKNQSEGDLAKLLGEIRTADYIEFEKADGKTSLEVEKGAIDTIATALGITPAEFGEAVAEAQASLDAGTPAETSEEKAAREAAAKKAADDEEAKKIAEAKRKNAPAIGLLKVDDKGNILTPEEKKMSKKEMYTELCKAFIGVKAHEKLQKGNILVPGDLSPAGTLTPAQSGMLISLMVDQSAFLKKIQVKRMTSTKQDVNVWDLYGRKMTRQPDGFFPSADTYLSKVTNKSLTMQASKGNIMVVLTDEMMRAYANELPTWEQDIVNGIAMQIANELLDLGFNGLADTTGAQENTWTNLAKGWYKRCLETVPSAQQVSVAAITPAPTTIKEKWDALIKACRTNNVRFFDNTDPLVVSSVDWDARESEMTDRPDALTIEILGSPQKFRSRPVEEISFLDTDKAIHTDYMNFVLGVVGGDAEGVTMKTYPVPNGNLLWVTAYFDFEMVNYDAAGILKA